MTERDRVPPLRPRLQCCAGLIPPCDTVADVGTDHGYLPIRLLRDGICRHVIAADLREQPLETARRNAERFGTAAQTEFLRSDGLRDFGGRRFDVLVCAGMGGDLIARILSEAPWLRGCTLVLQPQSSGNDLRRWLGENGWRIEAERLVKDGRFLYAAMRVRFGGGRAFSPGEQFVSPALRAADDPLLGVYLARLLHSLELTVAGISRGETDEDRRKLAYYAAALRELKELACHFL